MSNMKIGLELMNKDAILMNIGSDYLNVMKTLHTLIMD